MKKLLLVLMLVSLSAPAAEPVCPGTVLRIPTNDAVNPNDLLLMDEASKECPKRFPKAPCVQSVERHPDGKYKVTCGPALPSA